MKNTKKLLLLLGILIFLNGCNTTPPDNTENSSNKGDITMEYTQESIDILVTALNCNQENAESIMRSLNRQSIDNLTAATLIDSEKGYKLKVTDTKEKDYILSIDKKYHLSAIQEDTVDGTYLYREVE